MAEDLSGHSPDIIDSHVHLDHIRSSRPERIAWMRQNQYFPVSWAFSLAVEDAGDLKRYLAEKDRAIRELDRYQLPCRYLAGVHPRNIVPKLKPESVRDLLMPYLENDWCLGVGEIGLETGDAHEVEVLCAHLELCPEVAQMEKVYGIHTPRRNKGEITRKILDMLEPYQSHGGRIVVDHCMPETIGRVLADGFWAGVTLSPVKAGPADVHKIIDRHGADASAIMLNTDSGAEFYEDLYRFAQEPSVAAALRDQLTRENAARFFNLRVGH